METFCHCEASDRFDDASVGLWLKVVRFENAIFVSPRRIPYDACEKTGDALLRHICIKNNL